MRWKVFDHRDLVPPEWADGGRTVNVFNNAALATADGLVMAYRVVQQSGSRHIGICRLDGDWNVVPGSVRPFSDHLAYADEGTVDDAYHLRPADARLVELQGRLYMHFNCGSQPRPNKIYLVEVDRGTLLPAGPVREVVRTGSRRTVEKNWMLFGDGDDVYAIYSWSPLVILAVDLTGADTVVCTPAFEHSWDAFAYEHAYGEIRGGATPVRIGDRLYCVGHSAFRADPTIPWETAGDLCYVAPLVVLEAAAPFAPLMASAHPVLETSPREMAMPYEPRLDNRCLEDVYPNGAFATAAGLAISYGVNTRYAVLRELPTAAVEGSLIPALVHQPAAAKDDAALDGAMLRVFWWQPSPTTPRDPRLAMRRTGGTFVHGNFGDLLVPHLLPRLTGLPPIHHERAAPRLFTIGSLIQTTADGDVIWGTGLNGGSPEMRNDPRTLHVYATRGPLSLEYLRRRGYDVGRVKATFDPAALLGHLFAREIAQLAARPGRRKKDFIVIPHYRDESAMRRLHPEYDDRIRSVDTPFFALIGDILDAELVVSSSLHGVIIAESLGVPAVWHRPIMGENELKFTDYYLGTDRWRIVRAESLAEALRVSPMPLPKLDAAAMLATFPPLSELEELGVLVRPRPIATDEVIALSDPPIDRVRLLAGWAKPEDAHVWSTHRHATIELMVGTAPLDGIAAELKVAPFLPGDGQPQTLTVTSDDRILGQWSLATADQHAVRVPLGDAHVADGRLVLTLEIGRPTSPASRGLSPDVRELGVALATIELKRDGEAAIPR
ncbi:MAG: polysaccharide pyruvyl transferase family protein [Alphaproteobacteria bacterium]